MSDCNFFHEVKTEKKPWTHLDFGDRGDGTDFSFAIVSDRTGRPRPGVFENAIDKVNKMRPDFVMSVGDYIDGFNREHNSRRFLLSEWKEFMPMVQKCIPPFFFIVGNHDCLFPCKAYPEMHDRMEKIWLELFGVTHYYFIYKNTLFLCLNSMADFNGGIDAEQTEWAKEILKKNPDVRWTFVFLHHPAAWHYENFGRLEEALYERNYTVISGDLHQYTKFVRNGRKYFMLGVTGGGTNDPAKPMRGVPYGEFDHITWVSMHDCQPEFLNLALDGMYDEDVVTTDKITWLTPEYFRADKPISKAEARRLRKMGIQIEK